MQLIIENLEDCTGCSACYSICPKNAISMQPNDKGFCYPHIDENKCINCKKCENTCPVLNTGTFLTSLKDAYAFLNYDEDVRYNSSSGGAFSALAKQIIMRGGIVFGALDLKQRVENPKCVVIL